MGPARTKSLLLARWGGGRSAHSQRSERIERAATYLGGSLGRPSCATLWKGSDPDNDSAVLADGLLDALGYGDADAVLLGTLLDDDERAPARLERQEAVE